MLLQKAIHQIKSNAKQTAKDTQCMHTQIISATFTAGSLLLSLL